MNDFGTSVSTRGFGRRGGGGVELHILNTLGFLLEHVEFLDIMNMCTDSFPWIRQSKDIK